MSKRAKRQSRQPMESHFEVAARPTSTPRAPWLTRIAVGIAFAAVIARLLMTESVRSAMPVYPNAPPVPAGPGPSAGLLLDLLAGLCPLLVLLRRRIDPTFRLRSAWSSLIFLALGAWAVISTTWAADRFAAIVSGFHLLAAAGMLWAVVQSCRTPAYTRLTAGLCAGLLGVLLAHGLWHQYVERADLQKAWETDRQSLLAARNIQPGTFEYIQFENKILRGELMGFSASPNTYAALLVVLGLVTAGTGIQLLRSKRPVVGCLMFLLTATAGALLPLTQSRTAYVTLVLGGLTLGLALLQRDLLRRRATLLYIVGVVCVLTVFAFITGYGASRGTLFHDSLNFRWRYWAGAFDVWRQHPLRGVGWENFGPYYLTVRIPEATEEIKDPHNYLVRFAAELGLIGLALAISWTALAWWRITRPAPLPDPDYPPTQPLGRVWGVVIAIAAGFLLNLIAAVDFSQDGSYVLLETFRACVYLLITLLLATLVWMTLVRDGQEPALALDTSPAPAIDTALIVALGMFFIHNLVDFSMFEVGPLYLMALLLGVATSRATDATSTEAVPAAEDAPARTAARRRGRNVAQAALAVGGAAWLIGAVAIVIPIVSSEAVAAAADTSFRNSVPPVAAKGYESAFQNTIANGDYAYRAAIAWRWAGDAARAKAMFDQAIAADPMDASYHVARADLARSLTPPANQLAADDLAAAVKLDPNNARNRIEYAGALEKLNRPKDAAAQLRIVLELNDRLTKEERKRLPETQVEEIRQRIKLLDAQR